MTKKIALITGANKGIGFETARQLGELGITILVGARDEQRGTAAAQTLQNEGLDAQFIELDVTNQSSHTQVAQLIAEKFGKLDILVNNAGVSLERTAKASQTDTALWRKTFETNLFSLIDLTNAMLPLIRKSEAGRIINLSSILASLTLNSSPDSPIAGSVPYNTAYNASKAALNMFTVHLATELKDTKIKVNAAHPGWVKTDMGGEQAPMELVDGAKTSVLLATLPDDGPTGGYFHMGKTLPW